MHLRSRRVLGKGLLVGQATEEQGTNEDVALQVHLLDGPGQLQQAQQDMSLCLLHSARNIDMLLSWPLWAIRHRKKEQ